MPNRVLRDGLIYSETVNAATEDGELLYVRVLLAADDFGLLEASPGFLKARCLPARGWDVARIKAALTDLFNVGLLRSYEAAGKPYAAVAKWDQRRFAKHPKYPMPPWGVEHIRGGYVDPRAKAKPEKKAHTPRVPTVGSDSAFEAFWSAYPKKVAKPAALRAWKAAKLVNGDFERAMAALEAQKGSEDWTKDGGRFVPHPATWLNQRRFEDQAVQPAKPSFPI